MFQLSDFYRRDRDGGWEAGFGSGRKWDLFRT